MLVLNIFTHVIRYKIRDDRLGKTMWGFSCAFSLLFRAITRTGFCAEATGLFGLPCRQVPRCSRLPICGGTGSAGFSRGCQACRSATRADLPVYQGSAVRPQNALPIPSGGSCLDDSQSTESFRELSVVCNSWKLGGVGNQPARTS